MPTFWCLITKKIYDLKERREEEEEEKEQRRKKVMKKNATVDKYHGGDQVRYSDVNIIFEITV